MASYFRVSLGKSASNAGKALDEGWICTGWFTGINFYKYEVHFNLYKSVLDC